jgi:hypothetical protein
MKKGFSFFLICSFLNGSAQNVGIGTPLPKSELHLNSGTSSFTLQLTNNITTDAVNRGASLRMLGGNLFIENFETLGNVQLKANGFPGAYITKGFGNYNLFGVGTTSPKQGMHVHSPNFEVSMAITNGITTDGVLRGGRIRMANEDLIIINHEPTGNVEFSAGNFSRLVVKPSGNIGINNTDPQTWLQVTGSASNSEAIRLSGTNPYQTFYDGSNYRGYIQAGTDALGIAATTGNALRFYTQSGAERMTILDNGNVGIGTSSPNHKLEIAASGVSTTGMKIGHTGIGSTGVDVDMGNNPNNIGVLVQNPFNFLPPAFFGVGVFSVVGSGAPGALSPNDNFAIIGENRNPSSGTGVFGVSSAPSPAILNAGVVGNNWSTGASAYGVIGRSSGSTGAGTVGYTSNATAGLLGYANSTSTGPAIKSTSLAGSSQVGLELENGAIKVSGTNRTVFQHVATAGNITANETVIPNTTLANSATDLLIITPFYDGVYMNAPIGVYFSAGTWRIFRQDLAAMPINAKFNVLVVKQ